MKNRELGIAPIIHFIIILFWGIAYKLNVVTGNSVIINIISMSTLVCIIYSIYLFTYWNIHEDRWIKLIIMIFILLFNQVNLLMYNTNKLSLILLSILLLINLKRNVREKNNKICVLISIINFVMIIGVFLKIELLAILFGTIIIILEFHNIIPKGQKTIMNLLPLSLDMNKYFVMILVGLFVIMIFIFNPDEIIINIIMQSIVFIFEIIIFLNYLSPKYEKSMYRDQQYAEIKSIFIYINKNENEFSEYLHNDVLQDIISSRNLLDLNKPYVKEAKSILNDLQQNIRLNMSFYDTRIFVDFTFEENIESIINVIENRYPDKKIQIKKEILDNVNLNYPMSDEEKLILNISKELLNNAYKHSKEETQNNISIKVEKEKNKIVFTISSNNVNIKDYKNALKGGNTISIIRSQLKLFGGDIKLMYDDGVMIVMCNISVRDEQ